MIFKHLILILSILTLVCEAYEDDILKFLGHQYIRHLFQDSTENIKYEFFTPMVTDSNWNHIERYRRQLNPPNEIFYKFSSFGQDFKLQLFKKNDFISKDLKFMSIEANSSSPLKTQIWNGCFYQGILVSHGNTSAAISTCNGLNGLVRTPFGNLIIQSIPSKKRFNLTNQDEHVVMYINSSTKQRNSSTDFKNGQTTTDLLKKTQTPKNAANSKVLTVETAIFMDFFLYDYMRNIFVWQTDESILVFILSLVNAMQLIYNDGSLTNKKIQFVVIKVDIFKTQQNGFQATNDASSYLTSFCNWQASLNIQDDNSPEHWDYALMLTGLDLVCEGDKVCAGLAPVGGMCWNKFSCTLSEGNGFLAVFHIAHESGHTFGIRHDGEGNTCEDTTFIMAPEGLNSINEWSTCSKKYFEEYLKKSISVCLLDSRKPMENLNHERDQNILLGQKYDADYQCQVNYGLYFTRDRSQLLGTICDGLYCTDGVNTFFGMPAFEGTHCGFKKWCHGGKCKLKSSIEKTIPKGYWSEYSMHTNCHTACILGGAGLSIWERHCKHPEYSDYYAQCTGSRLTFILCSDQFDCNYNKRKTVPALASTICQNVRTSIPNLPYERGYQNINDESGGCRVWCLNSKNEYLTKRIPFPDGTPCGQNKKYCVRGTCTDFSCSNSVIDPNKSSCV